MIVPRKYPNAVEVTTDGMPTYFIFHRNKKSKKVHCIGINTGPGKMRTINIYNEERRVVKNFKMAANRRITCINKTFIARGPDMKIEVQEHILFSRWLGKGHATFKLW